MIIFKENNNSFLYAKISVFLVINHINHVKSFRGRQ